MIRLTLNAKEVDAVLHRPEIWSAIAPPGVAPFSVADGPSAKYFMVNDGDGVICFHKFRDGLKIHPNFLLEKRGDLAYKAIEESVQKMFSWGYSSIYAEIDPKLRHVRFAAVSLKFKLIEKNDRYLYVRRRLDA